MPFWKNANLTFPSSLNSRDVPSAEQITINRKTYTPRELSGVDLASFSGAEQKALQFCQQWLAGEKQFSIRTSGSTGAPKWITMTRAQLEASARQTIKALQLQSGETALVCLDTAYIAGQMMLVRALEAGMKLQVVDPEANPFTHLAHPVDFTALVPYQLEKILEDTPELLDKVRCALVGGASVNHSVRARLGESKCTLYATYGMTETLSHVALQRLNGTAPQDYFEALPSTRLRLDARGCLCIQTDYLTDEVITNDLVELIAPNRFRWLGRVDNIINSGGIKIIPEKVEAVVEKAMAELKLSARYFVAGLPHTSLGAQVTLVIEGAPFDPPLQHQMLALTGQYLNKFEKPRDIIFITKFQETPTGKINRPATLASH